MIDQFTMAQAKRDFEIGYLTDWTVQKAPMSTGWNVLLKGGTNRGPLVDARAHEARIFKTIDSAIAAIEQIGFKVNGFTKWG